MSTDDASGIDPDTTVAELVDLGPNERVTDVSVKTEAEPIHVNPVGEQIDVTPDEVRYTSRDIAVDTRTLGIVLRTIERADGNINGIDVTDDVHIRVNDEQTVMEPHSEHGERNYNIAVSFGSARRHTYSGWLLNAIREFHDDI